MPLRLDEVIMSFLRRGQPFAMWQQRLGRRFATSIVTPTCQRSPPVVADRPFSATTQLNENVIYWDRHSLHMPWRGYKLRATAVQWGRSLVLSGHIFPLRHQSILSGHGAADQGGGRNSGHDYTQIGGPIDKSICDLSETEIHNLIAARNDCRRARNFRRADI